MNSNNNNNRRGTTVGGGADALPLCVLCGDPSHRYSICPRFTGTEVAVVVGWTGLTYLMRRDDWSSARVADLRAFVITAALLNNNNSSSSGSSSNSNSQQYGSTNVAEFDMFVHGSMLPYEPLSSLEACGCAPGVEVFCLLRNQHQHASSPEQTRLMQQQAAGAIAAAEQRSSPSAGPRTQQQQQPSNSAAACASCAPAFPLAVLLQWETVRRCLHLQRALAEVGGSAGLAAAAQQQQAEADVEQQRQNNSSTPPRRGGRGSAAAQRNEALQQQQRQQQQQQQARNQQQHSSELLDTPSTVAASPGGHTVNSSPEERQQEQQKNQHHQHHQQRNNQRATTTTANSSAAASGIIPPSGHQFETLRHDMQSGARWASMDNIATASLPTAADNSDFVSTLAERVAHQPAATGARGGAKRGSGGGGGGRDAFGGGAAGNNKSSSSSNNNNNNNNNNDFVISSGDDEKSPSPEGAASASSAAAAASAALSAAATFQPGPPRHSVEVQRRRDNRSLPIPRESVESRTVHVKFIPMSMTELEFFDWVTVRCPNVLVLRVRVYNPVSRQVYLDQQKKQVDEDAGPQQQPAESAASAAAAAVGAPPTAPNAVPPNAFKLAFIEVYSRREAEELIANCSGQLLQAGVDFKLHGDVRSIGTRSGFGGRASASKSEAEANSNNNSNNHNNNNAQQQQQQQPERTHYYIRLAFAKSPMKEEYYQRSDAKWVEEEVSVGRGGSATTRTRWQFYPCTFRDYAITKEIELLSTAGVFAPAERQQQQQQQQQQNRDDDDDSDQRPRQHGSAGPDAVAMKNDGSTVGKPKYRDAVAMQPHQHQHQPSSSSSSSATNAMPPATTNKKHAPSLVTDPDTGFVASVAVGTGPSRKQLMVPPPVVPSSSSGGGSDSSTSSPLASSRAPPSSAVMEQQQQQHPSRQQHSGAHATAPASSSSAASSGTARSAAPFFDVVAELGNALGSAEMAEREHLQRLHHASAVVNASQNATGKERFAATRTLAEFAANLFARTGDMTLYAGAAEAAEATVAVVKHLMHVVVQPSSSIRMEMVLAHLEATTLRVALLSFMGDLSEAMKLAVDVVPADPGHDSAMVAAAAAAEARSSPSSKSSASFAAVAAASSSTAAAGTSSNLQWRAFAALGRLAITSGHLNFIISIILCVEKCDAVIAGALLNRLASALALPTTSIVGPPTVAGAAAALERASRLGPRELHSARTLFRIVDRARTARVRVCDIVAPGVADFPVAYLTGYRVRVFSDDAVSGATSSAGFSPPGTHL